MPSATGIAKASAGANNKLRIEDRAAHDWYRFVLSFPPHLVRDYLERFGVGANHLVLDPFCGTGTTLVECKKLAIPCVGLEANPIAWFASQVKVNWRIEPDELIENSRRILRLARQKLEQQGIEDGMSLPLFRSRHKRLTELRTLPAGQLELLLKNSISPLPLHKVLVLLETIQGHASSGLDGHQRLALAKAIVFRVSNLHFGPEVGVKSPKEDSPVLNIWLANIMDMAEDLRVLGKLRDTPATVHREDARQLSGALKPQSVSAVVTSPPYPNEKDYTRTTRLESVLLGFLKDKKDLRALKQQLIRSNTRNVFCNDRDDDFVVNTPEIHRLAEAIERRRRQLGKTSGFERLYSRVAKLYFGGMARHLGELRLVLKPGAQLAYVVGDQASYLRVMIRTGQILANLAETLGYQVMGIDLFRTRLATATKEQLREEVVLLRWPEKRTGGNGRR